MTLHKTARNFTITIQLPYFTELYPSSTTPYKLHFTLPLLHYSIYTMQILNATSQCTTITLIGLHNTKLSLTSTASYSTTNHSTKQHITITQQYLARPHHTITLSDFTTTCNYQISHYIPDFTSQIPNHTLHYPTSTLQLLHTYISLHNHSPQCKNKSLLHSTKQFIMLPCKYLTLPSNYRTAHDIARPYHTDTSHCSTRLYNTPQLLYITILNNSLPYTY